MEVTYPTNKKGLIRKDLVRYLILIYWVFYWLLNAIDKLIGGAHYFFVGKDRFAQIERSFDSIGLGNSLVADIVLIITSGMEIFAFVFFSGALLHFIASNTAAARHWFFMGIMTTLMIFTMFAIGDQVFGIVSELLEHSLFWLITLLSWIIYSRINDIRVFDNFSIGKKQLFVSLIFGLALIAVTSFSIFRHNQTSFVERTQAVAAIKVSENRYKIAFPFLAGSTAFEASISKFKQENPMLSIDNVYTAPKALRLGESDGLIIYIQTKDRGVDERK